MAIDTITTTLRATVLDVLGEIAPEADLDALSGDADIRTELEIDSFDLLTFMEGVAARTGVEVPEQDYAQVVSVDGCVSYLRDRGASVPLRTELPEAP